MPAHCFERSALRSLGHLARDLVLISAMGYAATYIRYAPALVQPLLWAAYWFAQGTVMTGVWVLSHECGHQAFSESQRVNDGVGLVLHSMLLVRGFIFVFLLVLPVFLLSSLSVHRKRGDLVLSFSMRVFQQREGALKTLAHFSCSLLFPILEIKKNQNIKTGPLLLLEALPPSPPLQYGLCGQR